MKISTFETLRRKLLQHTAQPPQTAGGQASGQALVEYALLLVFLAISFAIALAATGPAIGNVFGNVVFNIVGQDPDDVIDLTEVGGPNAFWATVTWVAQFPQQETPFVSLFTPPVPPSATPLDPGYIDTLEAEAALTATATAGLPATLTQQVFVAQTNAAQTNAAATLTATWAPPATATDAGFVLPFVDQMQPSSENRWRVADANPDDVTAVGDDCQWNIMSAEDMSNSRSSFFDENPSGDTFSANRTCYLELRGYLNIDTAAINPEPRLSFWDIHDFTGGSSTVASVQISAVPNLLGDGSVDRSSLSWQEVPLRSGATANYNWTRTEIDLREVAGIPVNTTRITVRFKLQSGASAGNIRWYIDDVQVVNETNPLFENTLNAQWNLDSRAQMDSFIFNTDSERRLELGAPLPAPNPSSRRWDITSTLARSGTSFHSGNLIRHPQGGPRTYELRLRYPINLTSAPATDFEGDSGPLILSFWHGYDAPKGIRLEVQYTTDPVTNLNPTWTTFPNEGLLLDFDDPSGAPLPNQQTARSNMVMQRVQIDLTSVSSQIFRVRFLASVNYEFNSAPTANGNGWFIDDIRIERRGSSQYHPYPFTDYAQDTAFTNANWLATGSWGISSESGFNGSSQSYSDSPSAAYLVDNLPKTFAMTRLIDLLNDTPNKSAEDQEGSRPAAVDPFLSFWFRRNTSVNVILNVDMWNQRSGTWTTIWTYNPNLSGVRATNYAWERVEIDVREAVARSNGSGWTWGGTGSTSITGNTCDLANLNNCLDDDIKVRFLMQASTGAVSQQEGFFVDDIRIGELPTITHRLWTGSGGNGDTYNDYLEWSAVDFPNNWHVGAFQQFSPPSGCATLFAHTRESLGSGMLHDSPSANCPDQTLSNMSRYGNYTLSIVEMRRVIDLTSTPNFVRPILYFWSRREIGTGDSFRVEVATENTSDTSPQAYNDMAGWNAWATVWSVSSSRRDTWMREQIDLTPYIGTRIRVRWVIDAPDGSLQGDGWYLDGIRVTYNTGSLFTTFTVNESAITGNWVREGLWGAGTDFFLSSVSSPAIVPELIGNWAWTVYYDGDTDGQEFNTPVYEPPTSPPLAIIYQNLANGVPPFTSGPTQYYAQRFVKTGVQLPVGTYTFSLISNDGGRLYFDTNAGTNLNTFCASSDVSSQYCLIERWTTGAASLSARTITVSSVTPRTVTVDHFQATNTAVIAMGATTSQYSFTDSPNSGTIASPGATYTFLNSVSYGNSSLILNGVINTNAIAGSTNYLNFRRLYLFEANMLFTAEYSTDGGFTWTALSGANAGSTGGRTAMFPVAVSGFSGLPNANTQDWEQVQGLALPETDALLIRFRLSTFSAVSTSDGVYVTDIYID